MKTKSIWGNPPKRLYKLMKMAEEKFNNDFTTCIVGCSDGKFLMPFARKGHLVIGYDIDDVALYGGEKIFPIVPTKRKYTYRKNFVSKKYKLESKRVFGVIERLEEEKIANNAIIEKRNFYKNVPNIKYDVVFTSCSLHYTINKDYSLKDKINKLQSIVAPKGLLYIDYMMAIDETDYTNYPKNKFFRKGEIKNYYGADWKILSIKENNQPSFEGAHVDCVTDHFHRWGYVLAERLK